MWGLATIRSINNEAAARARRYNKQPYRLSDPTAIDSFPPFPFPHLGCECDKVDEDHERVATLFCDGSGFGSPTEPALTQEQLKDRLTRLLDEHGDLLLAIEEVGQFQLYLAVWRAS